MALERRDIDTHVGVGASGAGRPVVDPSPVGRTMTAEPRRLSTGIRKRCGAGASRSSGASKEKKRGQAPLLFVGCEWGADAAPPVSGGALAFSLETHRPHGRGFCRENGGVSAPLLR
jgi:hypothetical protein